ncbi:hypothetical protein FDECE_11334 [Fusarium decemcellulare]|nr:hypothetical protein FDECE_11334 [Fusarium decemcellulare]
MPLARRVEAPEGIVIAGRHIRRGTSVAVCNHAFHHNPDVWGADHNVFNPERWDDEETAKRARHLMHFGLGGRQCLGKTVAQTNIYKLTSTLLRLFDFQLADSEESIRAVRGEFSGILPELCGGEKPKCARCINDKLDCAGNDDKSTSTSHPLVNKTPSRTTPIDSGRDARNESEVVSSVVDSHYEETGSACTPINTESPQDVLATRLFERLPAYNTGHFGPSSNHALFRNLTAEMVSQGYRNIQHSFQDEGKSGSPSVLPSHCPAVHKSATFQPTKTGFPSQQASLQLIAKFFDTVGAVLPFLSEITLVKAIHEVYNPGAEMNPTPDTRALLNIAFAHALSTLNNPTSEHYYLQALKVLGHQTARIYSLESLQACLLLSSFQQNSRRAIASWTTHSTAVSMSYQLGIHDQASYDYLDLEARELRTRVWLALVMQDRALSAALGRPSLISIRYDQAELDRLLDTPRTAGHMRSAVSEKTNVYFKHLV